MKKKLLALAFAILVFPFALLLTACGGSKLQMDKTYVLDSLEIIWGDSQETNALLAGKSEAEFIEQTKTLFEKSSLEFKSNGTVVSEVEEMQTTMYYQTKGKTVTIYQDSAKTQVVISMEIVGEKLVQEQAIVEGMTTKIKITYKVGTIVDNGDDSDDGDNDDDDGDTTPQLQIGKTYIFEKLEIIWGSNEEKNAYLGLTSMTEQQFIQMMQNQFDSTVLVFNQDGTLIVRIDNQSETNYYTVEGDVVTIYEDSAKTEAVETLIIDTDTVAFESALAEGMTTNIKVTYKVGTIIDDGDDDDDDDDDTTPQLQIGKTYVFNNLEIVWGSNEEKEAYLALTGMTEEQLISSMNLTFRNTYLLFNQDGTLSSNAGDGVEGATYYYDVEGDIVTAYEDSAKTLVAATIKLIDSETFVHEEPMSEFSSSRVKMFYKVGTVVDDGDDDDDDNDDDNQGLQIGKKYVVSNIEFNWATEQEKEMFLGSVSEQQFIAMMLAQMQDAYIMFNQDESVVSFSFGDEFVSYYSVNGDTITIYDDLEKTEFAATLKVVGNTLVQEQVIEQGFSSTAKIIYKVGTVVDDGDDDDDDTTPQLQIGKTYIVSNIEFNWANEQEKEQLLQGVEEQQFIQMMKAMMAEATIVFNQDGTVVSQVGTEPESIDYYTLTGTTLQVFANPDNTELLATIRVVGSDSIVQEQAAAEGMQTIVKITYKVQTSN